MLWSDNVDARELQPNGAYDLLPVAPGEPRRAAQPTFISAYEEKPDPDLGA
jgi:hypothetical protein